VLPAPPFFWGWMMAYWLSLTERTKALGSFCSLPVHRWLGLAQVTPRAQRKLSERSHHCGHSSTGLPWSSDRLPFLIPSWLLALDLVSREEQRPEKRGRVPAAKPVRTVFENASWKQNSCFSIFKESQKDNTADGYFCSQRTVWRGLRLPCSFSIHI
jgi:hypothetical protein